MVTPGWCVTTRKSITNNAEASCILQIRRVVTKIGRVNNANSNLKVIQSGTVSMKDKTPYREPS